MPYSPFRAAVLREPDHSKLDGTPPKQRMEAPAFRQQCFIAEIDNEKWSRMKQISLQLSANGVVSHLRKSWLNIPIDQHNQQNL